MDLDDKPNVYQQQIQVLEQKALQCPFPELKGELAEQVKSLKVKAREIDLYPDRAVQLAREFYKQHDKLQERLDILMPESKAPDIEPESIKAKQESPKSTKSEMLQVAQKALQDVKSGKMTPTQAIQEVRKTHEELKQEFLKDSTKTKSQKVDEIAEFKVTIQTLQQLQQAARVDQQNPDFASQMRAHQSQLSQIADEQRKATGGPSIFEERVQVESQRIMSITRGTLNGEGPSTKPPSPPLVDVKQDESGPSKPEVEKPDPAKDMLLKIQKQVKSKSDEYSSKRKESKGITGIMYSAGKGGKKDEMLKELSERLSKISPKSDDLKGEMLKVLDDMESKYKNSPSQEVSSMMLDMRKEANKLPDPDVTTKQTVRKT